MENFDIYNDIASRTNGDIYIGVVGPVRTGKSTFITRFMQELVIPDIANGQREVATDELPQSAQGKTIMTTEPKFVPSQAVTLNLTKSTAKIRLIDCVGYVVDDALGQKENDEMRMVKTPWQEELMPFDKAAEFGTKKVICEHSTIGIVVTCDGSFLGIDRDSYVQAENRVITELKNLKKPFIVLLNTQNPNLEDSKNLQKELENKYGVKVILNNVLTMTKDDFKYVLESVLMEFPLKVIDIKMPQWIRTQPLNCPLIQNITKMLSEHLCDITNMRSFEKIENVFLSCDDFEDYSKVNLDTSCGKVTFELKLTHKAYLDAISFICGEDIGGEFELINYIKELSQAKTFYQRLKDAVGDSEKSGYGVVNPTFCETELSSPQVVKKMGGYAVQLKAQAKCLHIIRTDIETEIFPVYGSKNQCDEFAKNISDDSNTGEYNQDVFGKPLKDIICEEVSKNSGCLSDNMKFKIRKTITKAVNGKKSNLISILI